MHPYRPFIQNRRTYPRQRRTTPSHALNMHFDNINILANIIQNSQSLLERPDTQWPPPQNRIEMPSYIFENFISNLNTNVPITTTQIDGSLNPIPTTQIDGSLNPLFTSLHIQCIDCSNINLYNDTILDPSNNTEIYDFHQYNDIPNPINATCPITREAFYQNQNVLMIRTCRHIFNKDALMIWLRNHNTCPLCRNTIRHNS